MISLVLDFLRKFHFAECLLLVLFVLPAQAHKPSESFLKINAASQSITIKWNVAIRDLDYLIDLDLNNDSEISGFEFKNQEQKIRDYLFSQIKLGAFSKPESVAAHHHAHSHVHSSSAHHHATGLKKWIGAYCKRSEQVDLLVEKHSELSYVVLLFDYQCRLELDKLSVDYNLLFDADPEHRALVSLDYDGKVQSYALTKDQRYFKAKLGNVDYKYQFLNFLDQGKWHIWTGYDHILFLLALLLPAVFVTGKGKKREVTLKSVFWTVVKIVTAFTVAHSITLSLAALEIVEVNSRLVEILIALSVAFSALLNLVPRSLFSLPVTLLPFCFGLIHGFGFAGALQDIGLPLKALLVSLFSFNLGVELGQLAIVACFVPIAYWLRDTWFYQVIVFRLGSLAIFVMAMWWFFERL